MLYIAQVENCTTTGSQCLTEVPEVAASPESLQTILAVVFGVIAAVAVLIIIIQGIKFVLSSGDPQKAADARKGIIYALVGLAVALTAEAIVFVVLGRL
jgi:type IV secretory pathway VirB2 component (pilin)